MELFTRFDGRISRQSFWLGFLGVGVLAVAFGLALLAVLPAGAGLKTVQIIAAAGVGYMVAALVVKRLHDRGKPAIPLAVVFLGPSFLSTIMKVFFIDHTVIDIAGMEVAVPGFWALIVTYVSMATSLWMVVELGFRRGTQGENEFGSDTVPVTRVAV